MLTTWKDLLTSYNGTNITYDTIGNPITIGNDELTWQGRELKSYFDGDYTTTTYYYNADGIRTRKEIYDGDYDETETHEYILSGSQIIRETVYLDDVEQYTLVYIYDELGAPIGIKYRTPSYAANVYDCYFFEKNLQGDIVAIYNASGTKIVTYNYDAWGNVTTQITSGTASKDRNLANNNPFRYRGYYYDTDIGMYYLQSRYYNPEWGRFLNADKYLSTAQGLLSYNTFAYCLNSPVNGCDISGEWTLSINFSVSGFIVGGFTYSFSIAFDSSGNVALQTSKADALRPNSGATFGAAATGISGSISFTELETVDDLNGPALSTGGSLPAGIGGEIITSYDDPTKIVGGDVSLGIGVGLDIHSTLSITKTHIKINLVDAISNPWKNIIEWVEDIQ